MKFYIGYTPWGSESYQRFADILLGANNVLYAYTVGSDNDGGTAVSGLLSRRHYLSDYCQSWVWSQWGSSSDSAMIEVRGGDSTANTFVALRTQDTDRLKIDRAGKLWLYDGPIEIDISGGDPIIIFDTASSDRFTLGVDASDSYKFKISDGSSLGSNDWFIIDSSGNVEIDESLTVNGATEITASLSDVSYSPGLRLLNTNTGSGTGPSHSPGILFENSSSSYSDYASCIYGYGNAIYLKMTSNGWTSAGALASFSDTLITLEHDTKVWGDLEVVGALSKGSGSFKIDHPLTHLKETHYLVHSFLESPGADLVYSGMIQLQNGKAAVNIDDTAGMTDGTFEVLCRNIRRFCSNETGFVPVRSYIKGNILHIVAEDPKCEDQVFWIVVGERQDEHMYATSWTDEVGRVIVEPEKEGEL